MILLALIYVALAYTVYQFLPVPDDFMRMGASLILSTGLMGLYKVPKIKIYQEPNALMKPGIVVCGTIRDVKEDFLLFKRECVFLWIYALFFCLEEHVLKILW